MTEHARAILARAIVAPAEVDYELRAHRAALVTAVRRSASPDEIAAAEAENLADAAAYEALRPQDYAATPSTVPEGFGAPVDAPHPPLVLERNGRLVVEWPHGRPRWFVLTPEALDELVAQVNDLRDDLALLETEQGDEPDDPPCTSPEGHAWTTPYGEATPCWCTRCGADSPTVPW